MPHVTRLCEVLDSQRTLLDASGPVGRITRLRLADIELVAHQTWWRLPAWSRCQTGRRLPG